MTDHNGHDHDALKIAEAAVIEDIKAIAAQIPSKSVAERVPSDGKPPFGQKDHDLMIASVDRITHQWTDELNRVRENTKIIEEMVNEQADKVKGELTKLHLLGAQAMLEAQRGNDVVQRLGEELNAMMEARSAQAH